MWDWLYWIGSNIFFYGGSILGIGLISLYFFQNKLLYLPNGIISAYSSSEPRPSLPR